MKNRYFKKWMKRYIKPLIKNLPTTIGCGWINPITNDEDDWIHGHNYTLVNGYIKRHEGYPVPNRFYQGDMLANFKRTAREIQHIISVHNQVHLRYVKLDCALPYRKAYLRMRLIVEKEGVHIVGTV